MNEQDFDGFEFQKSFGWIGYIDGLVQDCSISIANVLEILQSCIKPSI